MQVDDEALVQRITARSTCGNCGEVYGWKVRPMRRHRRFSIRRADDNEESLRTRLMAYYKQSPLSATKRGVAAWCYGNRNEKETIDAWHVSPGSTSPPAKRVPIAADLHHRHRPTSVREICDAVGIDWHYTATRRVPTAKRVPIALTYIGSATPPPPKCSASIVSTLSISTPTSPSKATCAAKCR
jgi:hypothetical protein